MKKFIPLLLLFLTFSACSSRVYTPVLPSEFSLNAVYETGDFSYTCQIVKSAEAISITPTSTYAAGMTIRCDGQTVTFQKDTITMQYDKEKLDITNPAVMLYEVFAALPEAQAEKEGETFVYSGVVSAGRYRLVQSAQGEYQSLSVPDAGVLITFS